MNQNFAGFGAVVSPIVLSTTYVQSAPGEFDYEYSRIDNTNRKNLEETLASIVNGNYGKQKEQTIVMYKQGQFILKLVFISQPPALALVWLQSATSVNWS